MKKLFKLIRQFFRLFILKLTPSGRKELMYEKALTNMKEAHTITTLEKRLLKSQVRFYINKTLRRKKLTPFHMAVLVNKKYSKEMETAGLILTRDLAVVEKSELRRSA